jgi:4-hydroxy-tetrahydrodipicolinate synthase
VLTPYKHDLAPDPERLLRHCRWLLTQGCAGLAVFGTTSEANSLSTGERSELLAGLVAGGVDPARLMPGTGCCALPDSVRLTKEAVGAGCGGVLVLPPFYYKNVSDEGLFRTYAELIERVGDARLRVYLYHIPQMAMAGFSPALIERLLGAYPGTVAGIKDSSGDFANSRILLERFAGGGFEVFVGTERLLLPNLRAGGAGCISATANVNAAPMVELFRQWESASAEAQQAKLDAFRALLEKGPVIPSLKEIVAHWSGDPTWREVRPPLVELTRAQASALVAELERREFSMPGLRGV